MLVLYHDRDVSLIIKAPIFFNIFNYWHSLSVICIILKKMQIISINFVRLINFGPSKYEVVND
ncbi:hypothetical protein JN11_03173 [Mucilaginibacter frigoritolerans]|uniref:Uncharacterized protein n=1 Tax=Mucilaginibacter frigoritolerans TaxID=652788 RepID=A0A562TYB8_9SPHI|nr:hypothetical protein JN11_03173 [Mucilaginibacter frigoritolerans]